LLGFDLLYNRFGNMLVYFHRKSLTPDKPDSRFQGLVFLASEDLHHTQGYSTPENEI
jgi:hypothetical protein